MNTTNTVTSVFGRECADELAAWAIDVLFAAPAKQNTYVNMCKVRWSAINRGRALLERFGVKRP